MPGAVRDQTGLPQSTIAAEMAAAVALDMNWQGWLAKLMLSFSAGLRLGSSQYVGRSSTGACQGPQKPFANGGGSVYQKTAVSAPPEAAQHQYCTRGEGRGGEASSEPGGACSARSSVACGLRLPSNLPTNDCPPSSPASR